MTSSRPLKPGDLVRISASYRPSGMAVMRPGDLGVVIADTHPGLAARVRFARTGMDLWWPPDLLDPVDHLT